MLGGGPLRCEAYYNDPTSQPRMLLRGEMKSECMRYVHHVKLVKKPSKLAFCFCIRVDVLSSSHKHICPAASTASSADEVLLAASCLLSRKLLLILSQPLYASCIICYCMLSLGHELCHIGTHTSKKEHQLFTKLLPTLLLFSPQCWKITEKVSFNILASIWKPKVCGQTVLLGQF